LRYLKEGVDYSVVNFALRSERKMISKQIIAITKYSLSTANRKSEIKIETQKGRGVIELKTINNSTFQKLVQLTLSSTPVTRVVVYNSRKKITCMA